MATSHTTTGSPLTAETAFQRDLLRAVEANNGANGLALKEWMESFYGTEIHHGRIYPNLDELVDRGLIEKGSIDDRTNSYQITDRGRRELDAHRAWFGGST